MPEPLKPQIDGLAPLAKAKALGAVKA